MSATGAMIKERRAVASALEQNGPLSHDALVERTGYEWDTIQQAIRELRRADRVHIRVDRRYGIETQ